MTLIVVIPIRKRNNFLESREIYKSIFVVRKMKYNAECWNSLMRVELSKLSQSTEIYSSFFELLNPEAKNIEPSDTILYVHLHKYDVIYMCWT